MNAAEATNLIVCLIIYSAITTTLLVFAIGGNQHLARENRVLKATNRTLRRQKAAAVRLLHRAEARVSHHG